MKKRLVKIICEKGIEQLAHNILKHLLPILQACLTHPLLHVRRKKILLPKFLAPSPVNVRKTAEIKQSAGRNLLWKEVPFTGGDLGFEVRRSPKKLESPWGECFGLSPQLRIKARNQREGGRKEMEGRQEALQEGTGDQNARN